MKYLLSHLGFFPHLLWSIVSGVISLFFFYKLVVLLVFVRSTLATSLSLSLSLFPPFYLQSVLPNTWPRPLHWIFFRFVIYYTFSVYIVIYTSTASPHCVSLQRWLEFIALFTTLLSQAGVLKMGNSASIPLPCWERVLSYLPLPDVQSLMKSNSDVCELIHQNRYFWHERAQQFYRLDPSAFSVLSNSETDILYGLVQRVCRAWIHLEATEGNVATDVHSTMDYDMKGDLSR